MVVFENNFTKFSQKNIEIFQKFHKNLEIFLTITRLDHLEATNCSIRQFDGKYSYRKLKNHRDPLNFGPENYKKFRKMTENFDHKQRHACTSEYRENSYKMLKSSSVKDCFKKI